MSPDDKAALVAIHDAFASEVLYGGVGKVIAVETDDGMADGMGGPAVRSRSFEILQDRLPREPAKNDRIDAGGATWRVIEVQRRDDLAAWVLFVEQRP